MSSCQKFINNFLKSTNDEFRIYYKHVGKINLKDATGSYKKSECIMSENDFDTLLKHQDKYNQDTFCDEIYDYNGVYSAPSLIILKLKDVN